MKILVCDPIHPDGVEALRSAGFDVDEKPSIDKSGLLDVANQYDALVIRGRTKIDAAILDSAPRLKIIGRAGVGLDNVDVHSAKQRGLVVLNTPAAPATSVSTRGASSSVSASRIITSSSMPTVSERPKFCSIRARALRAPARRRPPMRNRTRSARRTARIP